MVCLCHSDTVHPSFQTQQWAENQKVSMIEGIDTFWFSARGKNPIQVPFGGNFERAVAPSVLNQMTLFKVQHKALFEGFQTHIVMCHVTRCQGAWRRYILEVSNIRCILTGLLRVFALFSL